MATVERISAEDARRAVASGRALLVCAYEDDAKCRQIALDGAISPRPGAHGRPAPSLAAAARALIAGPGRAGVRRLVVVEGCRQPRGGPRGSDLRDARVPRGVPGRGARATRGARGLPCRGRRPRLDVYQPGGGVPGGAANRKVPAMYDGNPGLTSPTTFGEAYECVCGNAQRPMLPWYHDSPEKIPAQWVRAPALTSSAVSPTAPPTGWPIQEAKLREPG